MIKTIQSVSPTLPELGVCSSIEFHSSLRIEEYLDQIDSKISLTVDERKHLGELFRTAEQIKSSQFDEAIFQQWRTSRGDDKTKNEEVALTQREGDMVREFQKCRPGTGSLSGKFALGNILVASNQITRHQLEMSLRRQVDTGRLLGDELIIAGHASRTLIKRGLSLQRKLFSCALAVSVGLAPWIRPAEAAQQSAAMSVSVTVVANAKMLTQFQATQLSVSEADVARGYLDVSAGSRFSISTNSHTGYVINFTPTNNIFDSVQISGLRNSVQLGSDGGSVVQRTPMVKNQSHELSFRFTLNQDVKPGNYSWPLLLSVRAL